MNREWSKVTESDVPINTDLLITDGIDVLIGFLDSMLEWRFCNQDICSDNDFEVTHYMEFPLPPGE